MKGSIILAPMYIGGGLAIRVVGFSVGSVTVSSGSALNELRSVISCSHCFLSATVTFLQFFAESCHRPAFFVVC